MYKIENLELPRLQSCSFYPYSLDEFGDIVILMRNKKDSKNSTYYVDFGTKIKENEPNILYSATRSFISKTNGLILPSELETLSLPNEIEKRLKEQPFKHEGELFTHPKVKEIWE